MRIIDAHQHFWRTAAQDQPWRKSNHVALERDFGPAELVIELDQAGIDSTVMVQSVDEAAENDRLADYAEHPRVAGVVGWAPLHDPTAARTELERQTIPKLRGVRCLIADDPLDWITRTEYVALFKGLAASGLSWDVVPVRPAQVDNVIKLARLAPELSIVIDHLGRPPVETSGWSPWASNISGLGECPNISMKVSVGIDVLSSWSTWDPSALTRYIGHAVDSFGPERLMLASNWPVVLLRSTYQTAWRDLSQQVVEFFGSPTDIERVLGGNAERIYRLDKLSSLIN